MSSTAPRRRNAPRSCNWRTTDCFCARSHSNAVLPSIRSASDTISSSALWSGPIPRSVESGPMRIRIESAPLDNDSRIMSATAAATSSTSPSTADENGPTSTFSPAARNASIAASTCFPGLPSLNGSTRNSTATLEASPPRACCFSPPRDATGAKATAWPKGHRPTELPRSWTHAAQGGRAERTPANAHQQGLPQTPTNS